LNWLAGCALIYTALFGVGKLLLGNTGFGLALLALAAFSGWWIYRDLAARGWKSLTD
jgi:SSS family solute:Na+ symporter